MGAAADQQSSDLHDPSIACGRARLDHDEHLRGRSPQRLRKACEFVGHKFAGHVARHHEVGGRDRGARRERAVVGRRAQRRARRLRQQRRTQLLHMGIGLEEANIGETGERFGRGKGGGAGAGADIEQRARLEIAYLAQSVEHGDGCGIGGGETSEGIGERVVARTYRLRSAAGTVVLRLRRRAHGQILARDSGGEAVERRPQFERQVGRQLARRGGGRVVASATPPRLGFSRRLPDRRRRAATRRARPW